ncbi:MAG: vWA domain-containing protein [Gemmobacter sp.]
MSFATVPETALPNDIKRLLDRTKGRLFTKKGAGFLGSLLAKVGFVWTRDMPTAAINPKTLYWNPDFFMDLDEETRITVLAHELWHNAFLHGARRGDRCPDIWNVAADHVINLMLKEHGYFMGGFPYVMDEQFRGMSTEEVYDILIRPGGGGDAASSSPGANLSGDVLDVPDAQVADAVADVVSAAHVARMSGKPGNIPGEIELVIETFLHPKLPWETILFNFFNAMTSQEYSFTRPNRRYHDPIIPGITGRNGLDHLIYYLDISGSITDDHILRFNSEVKYIQETLQPERLTLVTFDTKIQDVYEFEREDPFEKIVVHGRGGTSLHEVFEHAQANAPTAMIVFTDLEVGIPPNPGIPIVWVCIENPSKAVPYGQLVHVSG